MKTTAALKALTAQDRALHSLRRIETLTKLLEPLGSLKEAEPFDPTAVSEAAGMIREEFPVIREALEELRRLV